MLCLIPDYVRVNSGFFIDDSFITGVDHRGV